MLLKIHEKFINAFVCVVSHSPDSPFSWSAPVSRIQHFSFLSHCTRDISLLHETFNITHTHTRMLVSSRSARTTVSSYARDRLYNNKYFMRAVRKTRARCLRFRASWFIQRETRGVKLAWSFAHSLDYVLLPSLPS